MSHTPELEKVARAIFETRPRHLRKSTWEDLRKLAQDPRKIVAISYRDECFRAARAALLAIRTPSEGMIAANNCTGRHGFTAAIDHVLGETKG